MKKKPAFFSQKVCFHLFFWSGLLLIGIGSAFFGYHRSFYTSWVDVLRSYPPSSGGPVAEVTLQSLPLGLFWGISCFLVLGVLWRALMEPLGDLLKVLAESSAEAAPEKAG